MIPQPHSTRLPPPSSVDVTVHEGGVPGVFMRAFDESGDPWAGAGRMPAHLEVSRTAIGWESCLVAAFTWMYDGPSPRIASIKVTGWSSDNDYVLTPAASMTRCDGNGSSLIVKIPTRLLA